jgi:hypothetical protein
MLEDRHRLSPVTVLLAELLRFTLAAEYLAPVVLLALQLAIPFQMMVATCLLRLDIPRLRMVADWYSLVAMVWRLAGLFLLQPDQLLVGLQQEIWTWLLELALAELVDTYPWWQLET